MNKGQHRISHPAKSSPSPAGGVHLAVTEAEKDSDKEASYQMRKSPIRALIEEVELRLMGKRAMG